MSVAQDAVRGRLTQLAYAIYKPGRRRDALLGAAATHFRLDDPVYDIPREMKRLGIEGDESFEHGLILGASFALALMTAD